jgi:hypothetical protein
MKFLGNFQHIANKLVIIIATIIGLLRNATTITTLTIITISDNSNNTTAIITAITTAIP